MIKHICLCLERKKTNNIPLSFLCDTIASTFSKQSKNWPGCSRNFASRVQQGHQECGGGFSSKIRTQSVQGHWRRERCWTREIANGSATSSKFFPYLRVREGRAQGPGLETRPAVGKSFEDYQRFRSTPSFVRWCSPSGPRPKLRRPFSVQKTIWCLESASNQKRRCCANIKLQQCQFPNASLVHFSSGLKPIRIRLRQSVLKHK